MSSAEVHPLPPTSTVHWWTKRFKAQNASLLNQKENKRLCEERFLLIKNTLSSRAASPEAGAEGAVPDFGANVGEGPRRRALSHPILLLLLPPALKDRTTP